MISMSYYLEQWNNVARLKLFWYDSVCLINKATIDLVKRPRISLDLLKQEM
jgi:hypothetical protein